MGQLRDALRDAALLRHSSGVEYAANEKVRSLKSNIEQEMAGGMTGGTYYCQFDRDRLVGTENA